MSQTLTKAALVTRLSDETGLPKAEAVKVLDALSGIVTAELQAGNAIQLPNLLKLSVRDTPEREVRNPQTKETFTKPAGKAVKATISKPLKTAITG